MSFKLAAGLSSPNLEGHGCFLLTRGTWLADHSTLDSPEQHKQADPCQQSPPNPLARLFHLKITGLAKGKRGIKSRLLHAHTSLLAWYYHSSQFSKSGVLELSEIVGKFLSHSAFF